MSLKNLAGVSLDTLTPSRETITRLIEAATRHIADAKVRGVSAETRFGSAYTAIRMLADVGLHANGYRRLTSRSGHHQTAIQTLQLTLGVVAKTIIRLDHLRKQRNATEYSGDIVPETAVTECLAQAESLRVIALAWLKNSQPLLFGGK
jgi:hypothetical protein